MDEHQHNLKNFVLSAVKANSTVILHHKEQALERSLIIEVGHQTLRVEASDRYKVVLEITDLLVAEHYSRRRLIQSRSDTGQITSALYEFWKPSIRS